MTGKSESDKGPLSSNLSFLRVHLTRVLTNSGNHHPYNLPMDGKLRIGQAAHVYLDSSPNQPLDAYVSRTDAQATFTPENTYFRDDRVKQVVGLKLQLKAGIGYSKPGMLSDGEIFVDGNS